jgi:hypothetical protein
MISLVPNAPTHSLSTGTANFRIPMKILQSKQAPSRGNKVTELLGKTSCVQLVKMKSSTLFVLVLQAVLVMEIFAAVAKENGTCMLLDTESFTEVITVCQLGRSFFFLSEKPTVCSFVRFNNVSMGTTKM